VLKTIADDSKGMRDNLGNEKQIRIDKMQDLEDMILQEIDL
jgi:chaperone required for assembly of F1-ATPase